MYTAKQSRFPTRLINISAEGLKENDLLRMLEGIKDLAPHGLVYSNLASSAKKWIRVPGLMHKLATQLKIYSIVSKN
jgi:hypothetical protein